MEHWAVAVRAELVLLRAHMLPATLCGWATAETRALFASAAIFGRSAVVVWALQLLARLTAAPFATRTVAAPSDFLAPKSRHLWDLSPRGETPSS